MLFLQGIMDGDKKYDFANAGLASVLAILMVFTILIVIIFTTWLIFKGFENKKPINNTDVKKEEVQKNLEIIDDDMMTAVLVATIDYRNEVKKDVRLVNVREIK